MERGAVILPRNQQDVPSFQLGPEDAIVMRTERAKIEEPLRHGAPDKRIAVGRPDDYAEGGVRARRTSVAARRRAAPSGPAPVPVPRAAARLIPCRIPMPRRAATAFLIPIKRLLCITLV